MRRSEDLSDRSTGFLRTVSIGAEPPIVYPAGRTCAKQFCITRLSIYNPEAHCSIHTPERVLTATKVVVPNGHTKRWRMKQGGAA